MKHTVTADEENLRADRIIRNTCDGVGYIFIQKLFRTKRVKVNGEKIDSSKRLQQGDVLEIFADLSEAKKRESPVLNQKLFNRLKEMIIFENDDFFAINKPGKLAVQPGTKVSMCVETLIKSNPHCKCYLVHRIDKDTSGILLIAKNQLAARMLTQLFREGKIKKTYLAVVEGKLNNSGVIDNYIEKSFIGNEEKMRVSESGQRAITSYKPLKTVGAYTLLELKPSTGRKHQLRVHCSEVLRTPILGDKKYNMNNKHNELFLHAYKLYINGIEITAEQPEYFRELISED